MPFEYLYKQAAAYCHHIIIKRYIRPLQRRTNIISQLRLILRDHGQQLYTLSCRDRLHVCYMLQISVNNLINLIIPIPFRIIGNQRKPPGTDIGIVTVSISPSLSI